MRNAIFITIFVIAFSTFAQVEKTRLFPDFNLKTISGESVQLSSLCEKDPILLTFWATWCKPCLKELRELHKLSDFLEKYNVTVVAVNEDGPRTKAKVKPFVENEGWKFLVLLDTGEKIKVSAGVAELPELFMLGSDRSILYHHSGFKPGDEAEYKEKIEKLFPLSEKELE